jgi:hypothetical protein
MLKRVLGLLALVLGFLGVVACAAGAYGVWSAAARLEQANDRAFAAVDKGLVATQDRVRRVQKRVQDSRITSNEITQKLRDWSVSEAKERLAAELEIERHAGKLAEGLQSADDLLETTTETMRGIQNILELGEFAGAPVNPDSLDKMLEDLTALRSRLQESERTVERVRNFGKDDDADRHARAVKLLGRAVLMITEADTRLEDCVARLSEMRTDAQQLQARISLYILLTAIGCYLVLAWIAAGQIALCACGWNALRKVHRPDA